MESGIINAIRSRAVVVVGIIFFSLILFIASTALSDFQSLFTGRDTAVGQVMGEKIDYTEFEARLSQTIDNYQQQSGANVDETLRRSISDQVWQQLVDEKYFMAEARSVGLELTPTEVKRLFLGPDESPTIRQIPDFVDPTTGELRTDVIKQFLGAAKDDERLRGIRTQIREQVVRQRLQQMYFSLVQGAGVASPAETKTKLAEDRKTLGIEYLAVNYAAVDDSLVPITEGDLRRYYDANKARYKQEETETMIKYVFFRKEPSAADSAAARDEIAKWRSELEASTDDSTLVATRSYDAPPTAFQPLALLDPRLQGFATANKAGSILGPELVGSAYELVKISAFAKDSLASIKARHILIRPAGPTRLDTLRAQVKADSIARVVTAANFGTLVVTLSEDPDSRFRGGDLGWIARGRFGADFDRAAARLPKGIGRRVVPGADGFHILDVQERDDRLVRLAILRREIFPSTATLSTLERKAIMLANSAQTVEALDTAAQRAALDVRTSPPLRPGTRDLPGLQNSAVVVNWALRSEKGKASGNLETPSAYVVAIVSDKFEKGTQPFDQVKEDIRPRVMNQAKAKRIREKLAPQVAAANGNLEALRTAYGAPAYISRADNLTFNSAALPGLGNEPKVVGAAFRLKSGQLSEPIAGTSGVFVLRLLAEPAAVAEDSTQLASVKANIVAARRSLLQSKAYQGLREVADIRDQRYLFGQ